jgi:hypothetical protein
MLLDYTTPDAGKVFGLNKVPDAVKSNIAYEKQVCLFYPQGQNFFTHALFDPAACQ